MEKTNRRFEYIYHRVQQPYLVTFVQERPEAGEEPVSGRMKIEYPVARLFVGGVKRRIPWTEETLRKCLRRRLEEFGREYGGVWRAEIVENNPKDGPIKAPVSREDTKCSD